MISEQMSHFLNLVTLSQSQRLRLKPNLVNMILKYILNIVFLHWAFDRTYNIVN